MGWTVQVGEWERDITFNFSPLFRSMIAGGLNQLRGVTADEAATIIWHGFRSVSSTHEIILTGSGPLVRGQSTVEEGLNALTELWQACIEARAGDKVMVF
jgi:hypothetical protein